MRIMADVSEMIQRRCRGSKDLVLSGEFFQLTLKPLVICEKCG